MRDQKKLNLCLGFYRISCAEDVSNEGNDKIQMVYSPQKLLNCRSPGSPHRGFLYFLTFDLLLLIKSSFYLLHIFTVP
jgi:hypothetical protein